MKEILIDALKKSLSDFIKNDNFLIGWKDEKSVYEVAISCKIASYLEFYLRDNNFFDKNSTLILDTEYNKLFIEKIDKNIKGIGKICSNETDNIRPDIIIHERGDNNNFCVIEIKKGKLSKCDKTKLEKMTGKSLKDYFGYKYGIGLSNFTKNSIIITLFENGKQGEKKEYFLDKKLIKEINDIDIFD